MTVRETNMPATQLVTHRVEKPWGRERLWPGFVDPLPGAPPIGEIWFQPRDARVPDLLVKYLFTSEKLSVQVHPDDAAAQAAGFRQGKDEAWLVLAAEPSSTIAIGTLARLDRSALRLAALDGSIEDLLDWKPVKAGDFFYSPAGTVHAIGAGITLIEVQQNLDLTYRLYDYGRPRELHLDAAIAVSNAVPFVAQAAPGRVSAGRTILAEGPKFVLERWSGGNREIRLPAGMAGWFVPITGEGSIDGVAWQAGDCLMVDDRAAVLASADSDILFAYVGDQRL